jgi:hypothetical protein
MNNQLAVRNNNTIAPPSGEEWQILKEQTKMLVDTGFLPMSIKKPEQAIAIILIGRELGIPTMAALNTINVIQQKPTISPQLMLALIERSGQLENIVITNKHSPDNTILHVSCTMTRKGRAAHTEIFGSKEANALGLLSKDNYRKQPATMFKWRAVAACARVVFPDVILGLYTPDEMGAEVEITDTEEITPMPPEETRSPVVVKMPQKPIEPETIQGEIVESPAPEYNTPGFDAPKTDYSAEWAEKLANPVKKEKSVSPAVKGKLLVERGCVEQTNGGFDVKDEEFAEYYTVTKPGGVIVCTCADYTEGRAANDLYRCAHIEAVKIFWANQSTQKQAA